MSCGPNCTICYPKNQRVEVKVEELPAADILNKNQNLLKEIFNDIKLSDKPPFFHIRIYIDDSGSMGCKIKDRYIPPADTKDVRNHVLNNLSGLMRPGTEHKVTTMPIINEGVELTRGEAALKIVEEFFEICQHESIGAHNSTVSIFTFGATVREKLNSRMYLRNKDGVSPVKGARKIDKNAEGEWYYVDDEIDTGLTATEVRRLQDASGRQVCYYVFRGTKDSLATGFMMPEDFEDAVKGRSLASPVLLGDFKERFKADKMFNQGQTLLSMTSASARIECTSLPCIPMIDPKTGKIVDYRRVINLDIVLTDDEPNQPSGKFNNPLDNRYTPTPDNLRTIADLFVVGLGDDRFNVKSHNFVAGANWGGWVSTCNQVSSTARSLANAVRESIDYKCHPVHIRNDDKLVAITYKFDQLKFKNRPGESFCLYREATTTESLLLQKYSSTLERTPYNKFDDDLAPPSLEEIQTELVRRAAEELARKNPAQVATNWQSKASSALNSLSTPASNPQKRSTTYQIDDVAAKIESKMDIDEDQKKMNNTQDSAAADNASMVDIKAEQNATHVDTGFISIDNSWMSKQEDTTYFKLCAVSINSDGQVQTYINKEPNPYLFFFKQEYANYSSLFSDKLKEVKCLPESDELLKLLTDHPFHIMDYDPYSVGCDYIGFFKRDKVRDFVMDRAAAIYELFAAAMSVTKLSPVQILSATLNGFEFCEAVAKTRFEEFFKNSSDTIFRLMGRTRKLTDRVHIAELVAVINSFGTPGYNGSKRPSAASPPGMLAYNVVDYFLEVDGLMSGYTSSSKTAKPIDYTLRDLWRGYIPSFIARDKKLNAGKRYLRLGAFRLILGSDGTPGFISSQIVYSDLADVDSDHICLYEYFKTDTREELIEATAPTREKYRLRGKGLSFHQMMDMQRKRIAQSGKDKKLLAAKNKLYEKEKGSGKITRCLSIGEWMKQLGLGEPDKSNFIKSSDKGE